MTPNDTSFCLYVGLTIIVGLIVLVCLVIELHTHIKE